MWPRSDNPITLASFFARNSRRLRKYTRSEQFLNAAGTITQSIMIARFWSFSAQTVYATQQLLVGGHPKFVFAGNTMGHTMWRSLTIID